MTVESHDCAELQSTARIDRSPTGNYIIAQGQRGHRSEAVVGRATLGHGTDAQPNPEGV